MSRKIDLTKPLSDEDRQYLEERDMQREIAEADGTAEEISSIPNDALGNAFGQHPDAQPAQRGAAVIGDDGTPVNPDGSAASLLGFGATEDDETSDDGDEYDDEDKYSYDDLKAEVKDRKKDLGDDYDGPALNASRDDLVAWLRSDDEAQSDV